MYAAPFYHEKPARITAAWSIAHTIHSYIIPLTLTLAEGEGTNTRS